MRGALGPSAMATCAPSTASPSPRSPGRKISGWALADVPGGVEVDGLPTVSASPPAPAASRQQDGRPGPSRRHVTRPRSDDLGARRARRRAAPATAHRPVRPAVHADVLPAGPTDPRTHRAGDAGRIGAGAVLRHRVHGRRPRRDGRAPRRPVGPGQGRGAAGPAHRDAASRGRRRHPARAHVTRRRLARCRVEATRLSSRSPSPNSTSRRSSWPSARIRRRRRRCAAPPPVVTLSPFLE